MIKIFHIWFYLVIGFSLASAQTNIHIVLQYDNKQVKDAMLTCNGVEVPYKHLKRAYCIESFKGSSIKLEVSHDKYVSQTRIYDIKEFGLKPIIINLRSKSSTKTKHKKATNQSFSIGSQTKGLAFGDPVLYHGVRFNIYDKKHVDLFNGFSFSIYNQTTYHNGIQMGVYNNAMIKTHWIGDRDICGGVIHGLQLGVYNRAPKVKGVQLGIVNRCDTGPGLQIGLWNVRKNNLWFAKYLPVVNFKMEKRK